MSEQKVQYLDIQRFTGMNTLDEPHIIDPSESPYMVNMSLTRNGSIITRYGFETVAVFAGEGGLQGLIPAYFTNTTGTRGPADLLVIFYDGDGYYITNSSTNPVAISGTYGADGDRMRGTLFLDELIFGNGATGNQVQTWAGDVTPMGTLDAAVPNASIFAVFENTIHYSGDPDTPSTIYYPDAGSLDTNIEDIGVDVGNGQVITSMIANNDILQVYKDSSIRAMQTTLDSNGNFVVPQLGPAINAGGGAFAGDSVQPSSRGYTYYLSKYGVDTFGSSAEKLQGNLPLALSFKIDPTIQNINFLYAAKVTSAYFQNKYVVAVPMGRQTENSAVLVFDENFKQRFNIDNWVMWTIPNLGILAVFRDANKRDQLYFSSNTEPRLYKFNTGFSDDGSGYDRIWRSKTFRFGDRTSWIYIDLEGSKPRGTTIYVDVTTDGSTVTPTQYPDMAITDENFITSGNGGGYIGDSYIGDQYVGAAYSTTEQVPMYRWKKRIRIPDPANYGYEMYFTVRNEASGEGWKLTRGKIAYSIDPDDPTYAYTD